MSENSAKDGAEAAPGFPFSLREKVPPYSAADEGSPGSSNGPVGFLFHRGHPRTLAALLLLFSAGPAHAVCALPEIVDMPITLGIETHGRQIGGLGILTMTAADEATDWSLTLLSPGGLALFTATGAVRERARDAPALIQTGLDAWRPWLEQLPLGRDLRAAFAIDDGGDCVGHMRTRAAPEGSARQRCWRGPGGAVHVALADDRVVLNDRRRGYTLTLVLPVQEPTP